jgi:hypothetical protein
MTIIAFGFRHAPIHQLSLTTTRLLINFRRKLQRRDMPGSIRLFPDPPFFAVELIPRRCSALQNTIP